MIGRELTNDVRNCRANRQESDGGSRQKPDLAATAEGFFPLFFQAILSHLANIEKENAR
jgi:hypothetical protein